MSTGEESTPATQKTMRISKISFWLGFSRNELKLSSSQIKT
jgi:hypothetical protein